MSEARICARTRCPASVEAPVFPAERAAGAGVRPVAGGDRIKVPAIGLRRDADGGRLVLAVPFLGQDLDEREVLRIVERELRAQERLRVVPVAFVVAEVAPDQFFAQRTLLDDRRAEPVAFAGFERHVGARGARGRIDQEFGARESGVEVAVAERRAEQVALQLVVGEVTQPLAGLELRPGECLRAGISRRDPGP